MGKQLREPLQGKVDPDVYIKLADIDAQEEKKLAELKLANIEKLQKRRLNATEARNMADTSIVQLTRLYKYIRDTALEGYISIEWATENLSPICKEHLLKELEIDGYKTEVRDNCIFITW